MSEVPVQLIVAAFPNEDGADRALDQLKQAKKEDLIGIQDAAIIRRDADNKLHIKELGDMSGRKGAGVGAVVGGAIGLLFPPSLLAAGAVGAAVGGLAAKLHDAGFPDDRLKEIGEALTPGTSAIVAVIEHAWVEKLQQELAEEGARVVREAVKEDIAQQLAAGNSVAYTAVADQEGVAVGRAVGEPEKPADVGTGSAATAGETPMPDAPEAATMTSNQTGGETAPPAS